jgi:hypothetical protein
MAPYLMQPHLETLKISPPKRRMQIAIEIEMRTEIPGPVKIIIVSNCLISKPVLEFHSRVATEVTKAQIPSENRGFGQNEPPYVGCYDF